MIYATSTSHIWGKCCLLFNIFSSPHGEPVGLYLLYMAHRYMSHPSCSYNQASSKFTGFYVVTLSIFFWDLWLSWQMEYNESDGLGILSPVHKKRKKERNCFHLASASGCSTLECWHYAVRECRTYGETILWCSFQYP